jgi:hypothetical protein
MSIYLDEKNPGKHKPFEDASPDIVEYVRYLEVIAGKSANTAFSYFCDLRGFSRFMKRRRGLVPADSEMQDIDPIGHGILGQRDQRGYLRIPVFPQPGMRQQKVLDCPAAGQSPRLL